MKDFGRMSNVLSHVIFIEFPHELYHKYLKEMIYDPSTLSKIHRAIIIKSYMIHLLENEA